MSGEAVGSSAGLYFEEDPSDAHSILKVPLQSIDVSTVTKFQKVQIVETVSFGRCLVMDGLMQSTEVDEFIYHESLVQPAMLSGSIADKKSVYIGGGGELGTAREVLRHKSVERVVMCDIDGPVIDFCEKYMPTLGGSPVRHDSRLEVVVDDAKRHLEECKETFDVIIMDIVDPDNGPGGALYTREYFEAIRAHLNPGGVFVTQAGPADVHVAKFGWTMVGATIRAVFGADRVESYCSHIPSFTHKWGFHIAVVGADCATPSTLSPKEVDAALDRSGVADQMRFYDGLTHQRIFSLPKFVRQYLAAEKRVVAMDNYTNIFSSFDYVQLVADARAEQLAKTEQQQHS